MTPVSQDRPTATYRDESRFISPRHLTPRGRPEKTPVTKTVAMLLRTASHRAETTPPALAHPREGQKTKTICSIMSMRDAHGPHEHHSQVIDRVSGGCARRSPRPVPAWPRVPCRPGAYRSGHCRTAAWRSAEFPWHARHGTRLSEQPIHSTRGACCLASLSKKPGLFASICFAQLRLLANSP